MSGFPAPYIDVQCLHLWLLPDRFSFHFTFSPSICYLDWGHFTQARKTETLSLVLHGKSLYHKGDFKLENCDNNSQEPELFPYQALKDVKLFQISALDAEPSLPRSMRCRDQVEFRRSRDSWQMFSSGFGLCKTLV